MPKRVGLHSRLQQLTFPAIFSRRMGNARPPKLLPPPVHATYAAAYTHTDCKYSTACTLLYRYCTEALAVYIYIYITVYIAQHCTVSSINGYFLFK
jgi:hypothetical protein